MGQLYIFTSRKARKIVKLLGHPARTGHLPVKKSTPDTEPLEMNARGRRLLTNLRNLVSTTVEVKVPGRNGLGIEVC
jgi:hypothetical protein